jgi:hypothetical protein
MHLPMIELICILTSPRVPVRGVVVADAESWNAEAL